MQHSQNICLQLDFQSSSVELCAVENVIHCFHEKNLTPYLFLYLLFLSAILLKAAVSHFLPLNSKAVIHSH